MIGEKVLNTQADFKGRRLDGVIKKWLQMFSGGCFPVASLRTDCNKYLAGNVCEW